jgi:hypothetical protein
VDPNSRRLRIEVSGVAGGGQLVVSCQEDQEVAIPLEQLKAVQSTTLDLSGLQVGTTLNIRVEPAAAGGVGYVVYKQITLLPR